MALADSEQAVLDGVPTELYVAGEWRPASGGATLAVDDPATGSTLTEVADAQVEDARAGAGRGG